MARASESRAEIAARELLEIRGWEVSRPPRGQVYWKHEYRENPLLLEALSASSKSGGGAGYPDFIVMDLQHDRPVIIGETKADADDINKAAAEARKYAKAFSARGIDVLSAGIAGCAEDRIDVRVHKRQDSSWKPIQYRKSPIQWLPTPDEASELLLNPDLFALDPEVPPVDVLAEKAEQINRLLRECSIKDDHRPAVVAAFMLALWKTKGNISTHSEYVLPAINTACRKAFQQAEKYEIADSIAVEEANEALANSAHQIIRTLRLLNVSTLTAAHDYLGQLYEYFFRYTGGNTIGQFFTPRHVAAFMADLCKVTSHDLIVDPSCGTGGFLIASLYRMMGERNLTQKQIRDLVRDHLWGFETEPVTAALCVANMILRGDGTTGIVKGDCFRDQRFPVGKATIVLGNPPFPHKKGDAQPEKFVDRGLEALQVGGEVAMVVPASMLVKGGVKQKWRVDTLREHTLRAVIKFPDELFEPFATAYTNVVLLEKGKPHDLDVPVFFGRIENDGYRLKKTVRVEQDGEELSETLSAYRKHESKPGWYGWHTLDGKDWSPGAYIDSAPAGEAEIRTEIESMLRSNAALHSNHADSLARFRKAIERGDLKSRRYANITTRSAFTLDDEPDCLGNHFLIYYGLKELHSKEGLESGDAMIVSSSGENNGCYGFFDFPTLIRPPFATVPSTGSIGKSFVQHLPCGVTDDCLLLFPKEGTPPEALYIAAAVIRLERWRFSYGRKITPKRIAHFKLPASNSLIRWIAQRTAETDRLCKHIVSTFEGDTESAELFSELANDWHRNRPRGADLDDLVSHPSYQRIIGMGDRAVPHLLAELKRKPGHWFWALYSITGENPVPSNAEGNLKEMTAAWLNWGRAGGFLW